MERVVRSCLVKGLYFSPHTKIDDKNRLQTMENDIVEAIETAASSTNEGNEEDSIPVELVDEEERFQDGYGDEGPRFRTYRDRYRQQQKSTSNHGKGCC